MKSILIRQILLCLLPIFSAFAGRHVYIPIKGASNSSDDNNPFFSIIDKIVQNRNLKKQNIEEAVYSPDKSEFFIVPSAGQALKFFDAADNYKKQIPLFGNDPSNSYFMYFPDGKKILLIVEYNFYIYDLESEKMYKNDNYHESITAAIISTNSKRLFTLDMAGIAIVWEISFDTADTLFATKIWEEDLNCTPSVYSGATNDKFLLHTGMETYLLDIAADVVKSEVLFESKKNQSCYGIHIIRF